MLKTIVFPIYYSQLSNVFERVEHKVKYLYTLICLFILQLIYFFLILISNLLKY